MHLSPRITVKNNKNCVLRLVRRPMQTPYKLVLLAILTSNDGIYAGCATAQHIMPVGMTRGVPPLFVVYPKLHF